jgi:hypothetical protein
MTYELPFINAKVGLELGKLVLKTSAEDRCVCLEFENTYGHQTLLAALPLDKFPELIDTLQWAQGEVKGFFKDQSE